MAAVQSPSRPGGASSSLGDLPKFVQPPGRSCGLLPRDVYRFEVPLPDGAGVEGAVLSDQIKSLDWRVRRARRMGSVPADVLQETLAKILALIDPNGAR